MKSLLLLGLVVLVSGCATTNSPKTFELADLNGKWTGKVISSITTREWDCTAEWKKTADKKWTLCLIVPKSSLPGGQLEINLDEKDGKLTGSMMGGTIEISVNAGKMSFIGSHPTFGTLTANGLASNEALDGTYEAKSKNLGDTAGGYNLKKVKQ